MKTSKCTPLVTSIALLIGAFSSTVVAGAIKLVPLGPPTSNPLIPAAVRTAPRSSPTRSGSAIIPAYDPQTKRVFVVNNSNKKLDVINIADPVAAFPLSSIDITAVGVPTSVAVHNGVVALAVQAPVKTDKGKVLFFDSRTLNRISLVEVGALPDMVRFTPDGRFVLTADEGEPSSDYSVDPEGSVSIIDMAAGAQKVKQADVRTVGFRRLDHAAVEHFNPPLRIFGPNASVAQDLEPEAIAISEDSKTAWVTLQENNALAVIHIPTATLVRITGLGTKDHSLPGNGLDVSDKDGGIHIDPWPIRGLYQPDEIAAFKVRGETYLVMANEGEVRDPAKEGVKLNDSVIVDGASEPVKFWTLLDPAVFPDREALKSEDKLGRLTFSIVSGDTDGDGLFDELHVPGARSFSIRTASGKLVWDSGDQFEQITASTPGVKFNANNSSPAAEGRSASKGPEPEGVAVGNAFGKTYAFIGLERVGGIMAYDVSEPLNPQFVDYVNPRDFTVTDPANPAAGDLGPEGLVFIPAEESPRVGADGNKLPLLVVANEVSGDVRIFEIKPVKAE